MHEGGVGHHQLHLYRDCAGGRLTGHAFDERVGHDLCAAARIAGGEPRVRLPGEGGDDRHSLGGGEQSRDQSHGVGSRSDGDPTLGLGSGPARGDGPGVEPVGDPAGLALCLAVAE